MKLLPDSLLGRNVLLLVALILIGQLLAGLVFRAFVQRPFVERLAGTLANDLIAVQAGLSALPVPQREPFIRAFNASGNARRAERSALPVTLPAERMLIRKTSVLLAQQGIRALWRREAGNAFFVRLQIDGHSYWLSTAGLASGMRLPRAALVSWLAGILLALAGALLIQRRINRPLAQLVESAHAIGRGETTVPLPEQGPREIADVCRSFNRMQGELTEQDRQRALMLAGVSHDLRTPLTKIRLAAEILGDRTEKTYTDSIARSCQQIDGIINQFIDFAGIGNREPAVPTDVNRLIADLIRLVDAPFALEAGDIPDIVVRPHTLQRVLANLIENARRYAEPDFVVATALQGTQVVITVMDRGQGIDPQRADELLKPFTRGSEARNGPSGAGLGLAIAARSVQMEGGCLALLPRAGGGLAVRIELPRDRRPDQRGDCEAGAASES